MQLSVVAPATARRTSGRFEYSGVSGLPLIMATPLYLGGVLYSEVHLDVVPRVAGLEGVHCTNQDTLTGPKGGRIRGSPLY